MATQKDDVASRRQDLGALPSNTPLAVAPARAVPRDGPPMLRAPGPREMRTYVERDTLGKCCQPTTAIPGMRIAFIH